MGAIVVLLVAIAVMLLAAVAVGVWWLLGTVRRLTAALEETRQRLQPVVDELREGADTAAAEVEAVRAGIERLRPPHGS